MNKFKVGDQVKVMSGKDRGKEATIESIIGGKKALLQGVNVYKKHIKKQMTQDGKGGIFEIPRAIDLSKLMIIDPKTKKPTRVGFKIEGDRKVRIAKKSGTILDKIK